MKHSLIMENWKRYLKEFVPDPSSNLDIAPLAAKGLSNKQATAYSKKLIGLYHPGKTAITPEVVQKVKEAAKAAWDNFGYNQFAELWNSTLGFILPELPKSDQDDVGLAVDIGFLVFEIIGYVFGYALLIKGYKALKKVLTPIFRAIAKVPGVERFKNASTEKASQAYQFIVNKASKVVETIKAIGAESVESINKNFEQGMFQLFGAV